MHGVSDTTGEFEQPIKSVRQRGPEPATMREAQASPEGLYWRSAIEREIDGQVACGVWQVVGRPKDETVLGTRIVFKRKTNKKRGKDNYMCRRVAQGFRQAKGMHHEESSFPTPAQASIRIVLGIIAILDWEARQLDVDMA